MVFVAVRSYDNYIPANMMMQRLEEEGIRVYLQNEHIITIDPILTNAIGGIKLMVYREQLERAMELISSYEQAYKEAIVCPLCRSTNIHYIAQPNNVTNWLTAITTWLFGSYALSFKKIYKCSDCGYESESLPDNP